MRVGLFGGTFNPFHLGHIGIIRYVKTKYDLAEIFIIPSATPPHKPCTDLVAASDRFEMVKKSIHTSDGFRVSDKELTRTGPSYTIDTITEFKNELDQDTKLFFLMGSDAFLDISTWKQMDRIFETIPVIIMLRGEVPVSGKITSIIHQNISKRYCFNPGKQTFSHKEKQDIIICKVPRIDISSTMIRERVKTNQPIEDLVPPEVAGIIKANALYK